MKDRNNFYVGDLNRVCFFVFVQFIAIKLQWNFKPWPEVMIKMLSIPTKTSFTCVQSKARKITNSKWYVAKGKYYKISIDWMVSKSPTDTTVHQDRNGFTCLSVWKHIDRSKQSHEKEQAWEKPKLSLRTNIWRTYLLLVMMNISFLNVCVIITLKKWSPSQMTSCTLFSEWSCKIQLFQLTFSDQSFYPTWQDGLVVQGYWCKVWQTIAHPIFHRIWVWRHKIARVSLISPKFLLNTNPGCVSFHQMEYRTGVGRCSIVQL